MASVRPVEYIKKKTGPYSQANKTNKITFLRFIFRKHLSGRGTSADLEKKAPRGIWQEGKGPAMGLQSYSHQEQNHANTRSGKKETTSSIKIWQ